MSPDPFDFFNWNSGVATTADLSLYNLRSTGIGNDFAVDTISFDPVDPVDPVDPGPGPAVPEPSSMALFAAGGLVLAAYRRKRKQVITPRN